MQTVAVADTVTMNADAAIKTVYSVLFLLFFPMFVSSLFLSELSNSFTVLLEISSFAVAFSLLPSVLPLSVLPSFSVSTGADVCALCIPFDETFGSSSMVVLSVSIFVLFISESDEYEADVSTIDSDEFSALFEFGFES